MSHGAVQLTSMPPRALLIRSRQSLTFGLEIISSCVQLSAFLAQLFKSLLQTVGGQFFPFSPPLFDLVAEARSLHQSRGGEYSAQLVPQLGLLPSAKMIRFFAGGHVLIKQVLVSLELLVQRPERRVLQLDGQGKGQTQLEFEGIQRLKVLKLVAQQVGAPGQNLLFELLDLQRGDIAPLGHGRAQLEVRFQFLEAENVQLSLLGLEQGTQVSADLRFQSGIQGDLTGNPRIDAIGIVAGYKYRRRDTGNQAGATQPRGR